MGQQLRRTNIYSSRWSNKRVGERFGDLMERQVFVHLAGGIAEAIHRGERRKHEALRFATRHCGTDVDLRRAAAVLADLRRLIGHCYDEQRFAERALTLLPEHWPAVEAMASALIKDRFIEGTMSNGSLITHEERVMNTNIVMRFIVVLLALLVSDAVVAQQRTYQDLMGRNIGRSITDIRGNHVL